MLIARAPTRISYAGGGTDMEPYSAEYGGMVVSAAIDKYFYVFISPNGDEDSAIHPRPCVPKLGSPNRTRSR